MAQRVAARGDEEGPVITAANDTDEARTRAPLVMILEDEPMTALLLEHAVRDWGGAVCGPHAGPRRALAALESRTPDAALLDVSLGGQRTSRQVADALAAAGVPFAFVTGYGPETAAVVAAHPGRLVIPKPMDRETVSVLLGALLEGGAGRADEASSGRARGAA